MVVLLLTLLALYILYKYTTKTANMAVTLKIYTCLNHLVFGCPLQGAYSQKGLSSLRIGPSNEERNPNESTYCYRNLTE